jgi:beta-ketodecanoyl-[acyl-carrier-protein] synthase
MVDVVVSGTGVFTPPHSISNQELVDSFNAYVVLFNAENAEGIADGQVDAKAPSSVDFIFKSSGIERRYVMEKSGILDPTRMGPRFAVRDDDAPSMMAEIALEAAKSALDQAGLAASDIDLVICAASNHERSYPAMAVEIQALLGAGGFAFDMNVACSSATFGIQAATDMIRSGSATRALIVSPEITSGHLEWRDRDCLWRRSLKCCRPVVRRSFPTTFATTMGFCVVRMISLAIIATCCLCKMGAKCSKKCCLWSVPISRII